MQTPQEASTFGSGCKWINFNFNLTYKDKKGWLLSPNTEQANQNDYFALFSKERYNFPQSELRQQKRLKKKILVSLLNKTLVNWILDKKGRSMSLTVKKKKRRNNSDFHHSSYIQQFFEHQCVFAWVSATESRRGSCVEDGDGYVPWQTLRKCQTDCQQLSTACHSVAS